MIVEQKGPAAQAKEFAELNHVILTNDNGTRIATRDGVEIARASGYTVLLKRMQAFFDKPDGGKWSGQPAQPETLEGAFNRIVRTTEDRSPEDLPSARQVGVAKPLLEDVLEKSIYFNVLRDIRQPIIDRHLGKMKSLVNGKSAGPDAFSVNTHQRMYGESALKLGEWVTTTPNEHGVLFVEGHPSYTEAVKYQRECYNACLRAGIPFPHCAIYRKL